MAAFVPNPPRAAGSGAAARPPAPLPARRWPRRRRRPRSRAARLPGTSSATSACPGPQPDPVPRRPLFAGFPRPDRLICPGRIECLARDIAGLKSARRTWPSGVGALDGADRRIAVKRSVRFRALLAPALVIGVQAPNPRRQHEAPSSTRTQSPRSPASTRSTTSATGTSGPRPSRCSSHRFREEPTSPGAAVAGTFRRRFRGTAPSHNRPGMPRLPPRP
jgi:hypothetical protein